MKIISSLSVESIDYDSFETLAGFDEFEEKYKSHQRQYRTYFYFDTSEKERIEEAKLFLDDFKLGYKQYFSVELDTDEELKNYPIVGIAFNTTKFPVLLEKKDKWVIGNKINKRNFHKCIGSGRLILSETAKKLFEKNVEHIQFSTVFNEKGTNAYYLVENLQTLRNPCIYPEYAHVKAYKDDTFLIENTDGRTNYSELAFQEIGQQKFLMENTFMHKGSMYKSPNERFVCSGEFAWALKKHFNLENDQTTLVIPTLNYV